MHVGLDAMKEFEEIGFYCLPIPPAAPVHSQKGKMNQSKFVRTLVHDPVRAQP